MDLSKHQVELTCPGCGSKFPQSFGRLQNDATVDCPGCKQRIDVKAGPARKAIKKVEQQVADLRKALSRIGKR